MNIYDVNYEYSCGLYFINNINNDYSWLDVLTLYLAFALVVVRFLCEIEVCMSVLFVLLFVCKSFISKLYAHLIAIAICTLKLF